MKETNRIVIPVDKTEISRMAVEKGVDMAKLLGVDVAIISIDDSRQFIASTALGNKLRKEHEAVLEELKKTAETKQVNAKTEIIVGDTPVDEIVKFVNDDDLIVMATHQKKGLERFVLGSVSEEVLKRVNCNVMILSLKSHKYSSLIGLFF